MTKPRIPRSSLPQRPPSDLEVARTVYALEIRRRNLQIKRQVALAKLGRIENELQQIEERLRKLNAPCAEAPPSLSPDAPSDEDEGSAAFLLNY
jgi:hypothetical protein